MLAHFQSMVSSKKSDSGHNMYRKISSKRQLKRTAKNGSQYLLSLNAGQKYCRILQGEHSAILSTFIVLLFSLRPLFCLLYVAAENRF